MNIKIMFLTTSKTFFKLLVTSIILWTNLHLSEGEDYDRSDGIYGNETEQLIDWDYETIVAVRWNIDNPPVVEYDKLRFDIHFSVSDYIEAEKHVRYTIYQNAQCGAETDIITDSDGYMVTWVTEDDTPVGPGIDETIKRTITISNQLVAQNITQLKSYNDIEGGVGNDASVTYCVRLGLWNGNGPSDPDATEINHLGVTVALNLEFSDEFYITGQKVEARDVGVKTSDDQFFVKAFLCEKNGSPPSLVSPFRQGEIVRICIQPTEQAMEVGFRMKRIETFTFEQGMTSQGAIVNAQVAPNLLTTLECEQGARQCAFETLLFSHFFVDGFNATVTESGETTFWAVTGSGEATLQWGGEGVDRRLQFVVNSQLEWTDNIKEYDRTIDDERILQERSSTKTVKGPTFEVIATDGTQRPPLLTHSESSDGKMELILMIFLLLFSTVLILCLIYYWYPRGHPTRKKKESSLEQSNDELSVPDNMDPFALSMIPEDQTVLPVQSSSSQMISDDQTLASATISSSEVNSDDPSEVNPDDQTIVSVKISSSKVISDDQNIVSATISSSEVNSDDQTIASAKISPSRVISDDQTTALAKELDP